MNANAKKWVKALRSGQYKQTDGRLKNFAGDAYCCLGVACEVAKQEGVIKEYDGRYGCLPPKVRDWLGLSDTMGEMKGRKYSDLTEYNDIAEYSFKRIANLIESNPKGLFKNAAK